MAIITTQKTAKLRMCASCEWVFKMPNEIVCRNCPKCNFGSYGAHFVYGAKCYEYLETQSPWIEKKVDRYRVKLERENLPQACKRKPSIKEMMRRKNYE